jgi:hypothetical protein
VAAALVLCGGAACWAGAESVIADKLEQNLYLFAIYFPIRPFFLLFISIWIPIRPILTLISFELVIVGQ